MQKFSLFTNLLACIAVALTALCPIAKAFYDPVMSKKLDMFLVKYYEAALVLYLTQAKADPSLETSLLEYGRTMKNQTLAQMLQNPDSVILKDLETRPHLFYSLKLVRDCNDEFQLFVALNVKFQALHLAIIYLNCTIHSAVYGPNMKYYCGSMASDLITFSTLTVEEIVEKLGVVLSAKYTNTFVGLPAKFYKAMRGMAISIMRLVRKVAPILKGAMDPAFTMENKPIPEIFYKNLIREEEEMIFHMKKEMMYLFEAMKFGVKSPELPPLHIPFASFEEAKYLWNLAEQTYKNIFKGDYNDITKLIQAIDIHQMVPNTTPIDLAGLYISKIVLDENRGLIILL